MRPLLFLLALSSSVSWAQSPVHDPTVTREFLAIESTISTEPQRLALPRFDITLSLSRLTQNPTHDPLIASEETYSAGGLALAWAFHWSNRRRTEVEASSTSRSPDRRS